MIQQYKYSKLSSGSHRDDVIGIESLNAIEILETG
jgi:hypothetical protein